MPGLWIHMVSLHFQECVEEIGPVPDGKELLLKMLVEAECIQRGRLA